MPCFIFHIFNDAREENQLLVKLCRVAIIASRKQDLHIIYNITVLYMYKLSRQHDLSLFRRNIFHEKMDIFIAVTKFHGYLACLMLSFLCYSI